MSTAQLQRQRLAATNAYIARAREAIMDWKTADKHQDSEANAAFEAFHGTLFKV